MTASARRQRRDRRDDLRTSYWRHKVVPEVLRLYGNVCHLCGRAIDMSIKSPHPQSFSVDHILGRRTGYDVRFLRPAHRGCNMAQGDPTRRERDTSASADPAPRGVTRWAGDAPIVRVPPATPRFNPQRSRVKGSFAGPVTVVCGPPGAGKSTYVREAMEPGDLILDMDLIYRALTDGPDKPNAILPFAAEARDAVLARLSRRNQLRHAWIVTSAPRRADREPYIRAGARLIMRLADPRECKRRILADPGRASDVDWLRLVDEWWANYEE